VDDKCAPLNVTPAPLDFSLQLSVSVQNVHQFKDVNPCAQPPSEPIATVQGEPGEHPRIAR